MSDEYPEQNQSSQVKAADLMRKLSPEKRALLVQRLREKQKLNARQNEMTEPIQLTNSQRWFFFDTQYFDLHHWNIALMLIVPASIQLAFVEKALLALLQHHEALRTRFTYKDSDWHAFIAPMDEEKAPFDSFDFSSLPVEEHKAAIEQKATEIQKSFNLSEGSLVRVAHFHLGPNLPGRLLFIAHHLVLDGSSLPILMEDFQTAYLQLSAATDIQLPPQTTSMKEFAERLNTFARSAELRKEVDYWVSLPWEHTPVPLDFDRMDVNTESSIRILDVSLSVEETTRLLREVPKRYNTRIMDVLLAALTHATTEWHGGDWAQFTILDSGRNILSDEDINLSRTVGVLFSSSLAILKREKSLNFPALLLSIKEQLRSIPHQGIGHELLLRCSGDPTIAKQLKPILKNEVKFNYLGQFNNVQPAPESLGPAQNMQNIRAEILYITAAISAGSLTVNWWYSENLHQQATIEKVAAAYMEALRAFINQPDRMDSKVKTSVNLFPKDSSVRQVEEKSDTLATPMPVIPVLVLDYAQRPPQAWWKILEKLIEVPHQLSATIVAEAVDHLVNHHDALRMHLVKRKDDYGMVIASSDNQVFQKQTLSHLSASEQDDAIEAARETFWASLNLENGPLLHIVFFDLGKERLPRLYIIMHHFVVDTYSINLLLNDFRTACKQLLVGQPVVLPAKTTSIKQWAERMHAYVHSNEVTAEINYWKSLPWADIRPTVVDHPEVQRSQAAYVIATLSVEETHILFSKLPTAYQVRFVDILMTACIIAYTRRTHLPHILMLVLHHGRNPFFDEIDLLRTVGSLYTSYPFLFDISKARLLEDPEKILKLVAAERSHVPQSGAAWHWISYYSTEKFISLEDNAKIVPNVVFNFRGEMNSDAPGASSLFREVKDFIVKTTTAEFFDVAAKAPHGCGVMLTDGQLKVTWEYFAALDDQTTIEALVKEYLAVLRSFIEGYNRDSVHTSPQNTPVATKMSAAQLMSKLSPEKQALLAQRLREKNKNNLSQQSMPHQVRKQGTNTFPLSFSQERLWILEQLAPGNLAYNTNIALRLSGPLDEVVLERSFNEVVRRHEVLRTTFDLVDGEVVQNIAPTLTVSLLKKDLEFISPRERETEALRLVRVEARQPIDLSHGPLFQTTLLRLDETKHVLLLTIHHIISDEWSMWILVWEMSMLYRAFLAGEPSPLPELPVQYADFAIWQRQWLQGETLKEQLTFWKRHLAGAAPALELPIDHPRPAVQTSQGAEQNFELSKPLTEALKALGQTQGATLYMTLLSIFKVLLYRYTRQADIVVGSPMVDRNLSEIEGLIGFFLNTLVLRSDLSGNPTFRELLKRVQETSIEAFAHRHLPFEKLVAELQPVRDTSRSPIFQVMFNLVNTPRKMVNLPGLTLEPFGENLVKAQFDLTLNMVETQLGLRAGLIYNTDLFDVDTISRMAAHFQRLVESIVANPNQQISDLQFMTEAERQQVLVTWNATQAEFPREKCIHELFEAQAMQTPDAIAVVFEGQELTYDELNRRSNQMARHLQKRGVGPEILVGVCLERSLEMVVGLLGILKAGGAYVPLDPTYPSERLSFMLADSGISVLLTQENLLTSLPACNASIVLDSAGLMIAQESVENLPCAVTPENLAYVIYTSGSTGKPKGVQVRQAGVVNFLTSMRQQPGLTREDILLSVTTLSFDIAGLELYLPLTTGARLVLVSRDVATDGMALLETLQTSGATVMQATPATWRMLISAGWQGTPSLKILCGGEALSPELAHQLHERSAALWNLYGPTETTIWSTVQQVETLDVPSSIGQPIANTQVYILDANLHPVAVGVPGELYIGGDGLARGYWNRPDLTAEKFTPNPFFSPHAWQGAGTRLYRTGDLVRYRPDGNIEFLGRIDHQVKIHGFRIELGEIETALRQYPQVRESVVIAREDPGMEKRLVAYLVMQGLPASPALQDVRNFLKSRLPEYMLPTAIVYLDELPLTPNGKVDRKALPMPDGTHTASASAWVAPRTLIEEQLAHIWAQVLHLKQVGIHDDFFELGGDSLLVLQVIGQARKLGYNFTPRQIFQYRTIAELAATTPPASIQAE